jgi:sulfite dehydrogenase
LAIDVVSSRLDRALCILVALAAAGAGTCTAAEPRAVGLMRDHKCYVCHGDDEALTGPAFADIAAAYRGNRDGATIVAALLRSGVRGDGPWHMPPHPEISSADAMSIARYILSLDRRADRPQRSGVPAADQPAPASPRS